MNKKNAFLLLLLGCLGLTSLHAQTVKKVLVEKFTSSNCGNCPNGTATLYGIAANNQTMVWTSIHAGWINDPMGFATLDTIADAFTVGAPKANIDRVKFSNESEVATNVANWQSHINTQTSVTPPVNIQISGTFDQNTANASITLQATFSNSVAAADYRLNLYVVEDSLTGTGSGWNQANYFNSTAGHFYQGAGNPILNYPHRNVVRLVPSNAWGTPNIIPNVPQTGTVYNKTYQFTLSQNIDFQRVKLVAFVSVFNSNVQQRTVLNTEVVQLRDLMQPSNTDFIQSPVRLQIFPNPAHNFVFLTVGNADFYGGKVRIFNSSGELLGHYQMQNQHLEIPVSTWATGVYFLRLEGKNGKFISQQFLIGQ